MSLDDLKTKAPPVSLVTSKTAVDADTSISTNSLIATSSMVSAGNSTYRLDKAAMKRWWQMGDGFSLSKKKTQDPLKNIGLRSAISFLLTCPIYVAFMLAKVLPTLTPEQHFPLFRLLVCAFAIWLLMGWNFFKAFRNHCRIAQEVSVSEEGLEIRSPLGKRKINWFEVQDFFRVGNIDDGYELFQLDCSRGEPVFLSPSLVDSDKLFAIIESKMRNLRRPQFEFNYRLSDAVFGCAKMAGAAVLAAVLMHLLCRSGMASISEIVVGTMLIILAHIIQHVQFTRVPQLTRMSNAEIQLQMCTGPGARNLTWDAVKEIKFMGAFVFLKTRSDWFILFVSKTEPIRELLLQKQGKLSTPLR